MVKSSHNARSRAATKCRVQCCEVDSARTCRVWDRNVSRPGFSVVTNTVSVSNTSSMIVIGKFLIKMHARSVCWGHSARTWRMPSMLRQSSLRAYARYAFSRIWDHYTRNDFIKRDVGFRVKVYYIKKIITSFWYWCTDLLLYYWFVNWIWWEYPGCLWYVTKTPRGGVRVACATEAQIFFNSCIL